ncbi:hypothetical protein MMC10_010115 [Thelotrema lepadinum]|nr:hypothetical protein [Thelotrema lepadinum]
MHSTLAISSVLFALSAFAQSSAPASSSATPTQNTGSSQPSAAASETGNLVNIVDFLIPSASITSLTPAQSTKIAADAANFYQQYTASHPVASLENSVLANAGINAVLGGTEPSPAQQTSIQGLLGEASQGLVNNPSAYISSVNGLIAPFPFATLVQTYENGFIDGLRTVVASDLSLSAPAPTTASSSAGAAAAPAAKPTGVMAGGVLAAAGIVGVALL